MRVIDWSCCNNLELRNNGLIRFRKIPLNPPFQKGEALLLPFVKGGWEGFNGVFQKAKL